MIESNDSRSVVNAWFNSKPTIVRRIILAIAIGIVAGLGAVLFYSALEYGTRFFLQDLGGYLVPTPGGEGNVAGSSSFAHPLLIPLIVTLGGLISGLMVFTWAPEAEGHGTDAAISAIHHNPRGIRVRAVAVKIFASAITIGSGGSGGREGPTAQISAGFGSLLSRTLNLSDADAKMAVSIGVGSGIGAIFSAPLGGALLASEIVYRDDFESEALLPGLVASGIAYLIFGSVYGFQPIFTVVEHGLFTSNIQLIYYALLGILCGVIGIIYSKTFYLTVNLSKKIALPRKYHPALGGLLVGITALFAPEVLGTGYGWIQKALSANSLEAIPFWIVILLPFLRIIVTSLSIGSGGSGGIFGPGMVIGAFIGAGFWRVAEIYLPHVPNSPAGFVIVAMMACFGSISRAPIAVTIMVAEMTSNISMIFPAVVAVGIASLIAAAFDVTIYQAQLRDRNDLGLSTS